MTDESKLLLLGALFAKRWPLDVVERVVVGRRPLSQKPPLAETTIEF